MRRGISLLIGAATALSLTGCIPDGGYGRPEPAAAPPPAPAGPATISDDPADDRLGDIVLSLPQPTPTLSPQDIVTDARTVTARTYVVQPGDTLRGIGNRTGAGSEAIARVNGLQAPYVIRAGQRLAIPAGRYHAVRAGETGIAIARAYGVAWTRIIADNQLQAPFTLRVGQRLLLPDPASSPPTIEQQAAAFTLDIDDIMTGGQPAGAAAPRAASPAPPAAAASRFAWPIDGQIIQRFGPGPSGRLNQGINIAAALGTPVHAAGDGTILYAGNEIGLLGGVILVDHGGGWVSAYGHLDRVAVRAGDRVRSGAVIATAGDSGQVQSPQLHFELRQNRQPVDPLRYLPAR